MSPSSRAGAGLAARAVVALMRAVPALFTVGWLAAGAAWLLQGRLERALVAILVAGVAASFGMRIAIASRR
jgi:predicted membrane-bound mannosyltransferase